MTREKRLRAIARLRAEHAAKRREVSCVTGLHEADDAEVQQRIEALRAVKAKVRRREGSWTVTVVSRKVWVSQH